MDRAAAQPVQGASASIRRLRAELGALAAVLASSAHSITAVTLTQEIALTRRLIEATEPDSDARSRHLRNVWLELRLRNLALAASLSKSDVSTALLRDQLEMDRDMVINE